MTVTADDLDEAHAAVVTALGPTTGADWARPAGGLEWDCRRTAEHLGDTLLSYGAQLAAHPKDHYVRFVARTDEDASAAELLEFVTAGARLLAAIVRVSPGGARGYHPSGYADPAGFAAMGCAELLLHGEDLALGQETTIDPPRAVCARVVERLFPGEAVASDPWDALRWCTGRIALPGWSRRTEWSWRGAPVVPGDEHG